MHRRLPNKVQAGHVQWAIGMAAKLMQDMGLLKTKIGQTICCAAMIDDVASLILLAMISSIATGESSGSAAAAVPDVVWGPTDGLWSALIPLITSLSFIGLSTCFATVVPHAAGSVLGRVPAGSSAEGAACLGMLTAWATMLTLGAHYSRTTFLLCSAVASQCGCLTILYAVRT